MRNNYAELEAGWVPGHSEAFKKNAVGKIQLYDSGGGGGGPQESTTYTTNLPEYAEPYYTRMVERAEALSQEGYQPYGSERIAGFTPGQQQVFGETLGMQRPGEFGQASGLTGIASMGALGAGQYAPSQFRAQRVGGPQLQQFQAQGPAGVQGGLESFTGQGTAEQFMSPYMQQVVDTQKRAATREAQIAQMQADLAAPRQGSYGGARQALMQAERERGLLDRLNQIQASGSQAAFEQAQRAFEQEQARGLQAGLQTQQLGTQTGLQNLQALLGVQQLGAGQSLEAQRANQQALMEAQRMAEQSRQFGATTGLQGFQTALQGAGQLAQIGRDVQTADLARLQAQQSVANAEQQMEQRRLDQAYQDFIAQREYPYRQLEFYNAMLRGLPVQANTTSTQYNAQPNIAQQVLGYGIPALALSKAFSAT